MSGLDNSFSSDGKVTTDFGGNVDEGRSVAIQNDGKIVVVGGNCNGFPITCDYAIARYNGINTGIADMQMSEYADVQIVPNPFTTSTTIVIVSGAKQSIYDLQFTIYDLLGREVFNDKLQTTNYKLDLNKLPSGIYFYQLTDGKKNMARGKLVKQ